MIAVTLIVAAILVAATATHRWTVPRRSFADDGGRRHRRRPHAWPSLRAPRRPRDDEIAEWCEHAARGVRAGSSLSHAVMQAGASAPAGGRAFAPVVRAVSRGRPLAEALAELADDGPASGTGLVAPVLVSCAELGGPAALPLERVAATLHARSAEQAERRANSAQARLSARVLTTVPLGTLALLAVAEPTVRASLTSGLGVVCVGLGSGLNLAGWFWMRRLVGGSS